jgi:hypothetical protein
MTGVWASSTVAGVPSMWAPVIVAGTAGISTGSARLLGVIAPGHAIQMFWNGSAVSQRELANSAVRAKRSTLWARAKRAHPL